MKKRLPSDLGAFPKGDGKGARPEIGGYPRGEVPTLPFLPFLGKVVVGRPAAVLVVLYAKISGKKAGKVRRYPSSIRLFLVPVQLPPLRSG